MKKKEEIMPKPDTKKLQKLYDTVGLSLETLKAKRREWRSKFKKLKLCKPVIQTICSELLPLEGARLDSKQKHLTIKQAEALGLSGVTARHNEMVAVCSMQNDAFQHMFELVSFVSQFAARYEEESSKRKSEMTKLHRDVKAALHTGKAAAPNGKQATPKRKPASKQLMTDFLRACGSPGEEEDEEEQDTDCTLRLFS